MKINVIYEDNHLLVVEKPVNVPVSEDESKDPDLLNALKDYLKMKYQKPGNVYLGLLHRLDRPVGGIMVFAKTSKAASRLSDQIRRNEVHKVYRAVVYHPFEKTEGTLQDYLLKNQKTNTTTVSSGSNPQAKKAELDYRVIVQNEKMALVEIELHTGRSHQIRVQFSSRNHPLYGDQRYNKEAHPGEQIALWATRLTFTHPTTKEEMTFTLLPPDIYPYNQFSE